MLPMKNVKAAFSFKKKKILPYHDYYLYSYVVGYWEQWG